MPMAEDSRNVIINGLTWLLADVLGLSEGTALVISWIVLAAALPGVVLAIGGVMSYVMRKVMARIQTRVGPNRVGPFGLLQFLADGLKMISKEDLIPATADAKLFRLAPFLVILPVIVAFAPIPFGDGMLVADLRIGLLFILAVSAIAPIGEIAAGWASNNKYSMLGGLRVAALDASYEIPMILSAISIVMLTSALGGNGLNTLDIVTAQKDFVWFVFLQPIGAFIFFVAALAKAGIVPMDLPESESELVAGYMTEYSGMRFGVLFVGVFAGIVFISALTVTLYFGGWSMPIGPDWLGLLWFGGKVTFFVLFVLLTWFTLPRVRPDQFLEVGWKGLFPLAILNLLVTVGEVYAITHYGGA